MASFIKRGKTWSFKIDVGKGKNGKRLQKMVGGFRTKDDAKKAAAAIENDLGNRTYVSESNITFRAHSMQWVERYSISAKAGSVRIRQHHINRLLDYFDEIPLKDVSKKQYQDCLYDLLKKEFAENTISGIHGTAKMIFKDAVKLDLIKNDPTEFARPPRKRQTLEDIENEEDIPNYMEKEELKTFLNIAHDAGLDQDYAIFLTLAYTGIRGGELCALKWDDIDFDNHTISVKKTYYNPGNDLLKYDLVTPKTKSSKRTIDIDHALVDELKMHQARQNKMHMANRDTWHKENFVFTVKKYPGYPAYVKMIENRMARLLRVAGLNKNLTPHSLRHTHTSLLAEAGVGLEEIMARLGHIDDSTTRQVYLHVTKTMKKEAAHKFYQLMNNP